MDATTLLRSADALAFALARPSATLCPTPRLHPSPPPLSSSRCGPLRAYAAPAPAPAAHNNNGVYTVGDFMTQRPNLHVVTPSTSVDEALHTLVQYKISGFPVIDDDGKLVGVVSDYDLLALDSISGSGLTGTNTSMFPEVDSTWKTFREIQTLLSKTNGKVIGDVMTYAPLVVRENTNLDAAARLLLETKYRRLPVVDSMGKLVGMITRGNVVRAALKIKKRAEGNA
ncbi:CBS domain-containing protein CBSX1, chloroplastic-like [Oryza brachyantha]|uniref:CBS domain-containing protein n=1 Tax=Oryza brachyantha TaxID=4533 RepID=J3MVL7_ORYBR|nr:CBS domain-containing protein CBSX1, chloroplastic-like [Oryza brachyantha]